MGQIKTLMVVKKFFSGLSFQLACVTLWLFPSSTPLFEVFQAARTGISALPQLLQNSPARSSQLAQAPAEPTPSPGVSEAPAHAALQLASLETAHSSLPRQLLVLIPEHKPQNTWKQLTWTCFRHKHSVVKFLTGVSVYNTVFANTPLMNIKCFVKAFVESSLEVW